MKKKIISIILVLALLLSTAAYIGMNAFAATSGEMDDGRLRWNLNDDGVFTVSGTGYGPDYTSLSVPWRANKGDIKEVVISEGVQAIGNYWFSSCSKLTSVELPDTLIKMGARCFQSCSKLENITIPENCCEYYNYIFSGCTSLRWAVLPRDNTASSYVHTIPDYTFSGCSALENVWVGSDNTAISANAFRNCSSLSAIIWSGSTINSIGSNFPSGAEIVGTSALQSWCSSNSYSFVNIQGNVSDSLTYSYSLSTKRLTLSGNGNMTSSPWNIWKYFIYDLDIGTPSSICDNAFYECEYLDGELSIPSSVTQISSNSFYGAGYDCYVINADSVNIGASAFGGSDDLTFYGNRNSGVYAYVIDERTNNPNWRYYCLGSHIYSENDGKCVYCDKSVNVPVLEPCGQHNYVYQHRLGSQLYYKCSECTNDDYSVNVRDLLLDFDSAISSTSDPNNQSDYDGRFDVLRDGYVNAKDYKILLDMAEGKATKYDMRLSNENATDSAQRLYEYLAKTYKNKVISGQQESTWMGSVDYEMNYIYNKTGKYPAIRGLDFMNDDFNGVVTRAKAWANRGGIVTICWHCSSNFDQSYDACKADELTNEQWEAILTNGTPENTAILAAMDKAGNALLRLQAEGIPVLWRPFHEFDGGWFWWGKGGSDYFKRLWIMMYNHFTYDLGLNNLIWVLGYCHNGTDYGTNLEDWYPGNRYCDIVGADSYEVSQNGAEARLYNPIYKFVKGAKPLAMHESGLNPTAEQFQNVPWTYFMTWHTTYLTDDNPVAALNALYNSDYVITLDEVENFYN